MVIKPESASLDIRNIGKNIIFIYIDLSILYIFGMNKFDIINEVFLFKKGGTSKTIEI